MKAPGKATKHIYDKNMTKKIHEKCQRAISQILVVPPLWMLAWQWNEPFREHDFQKIPSAFSPSLAPMIQNIIVRSISDGQGINLFVVFLSWFL